MWMVETTMKLRLSLAVALVGGFVAGAQAQEEITCADLVAQVDGLLATQADEINEEVLGQIIALRNQGNEQCAAGDEDDAANSLEHAISLFSQ